MTDDEETVKACPECDAAMPRPRQPGNPMGKTEPEDEWYCDDCGAYFDEPVVRAARASTGPYTGLAKRLAEADPETIPDGGVEMTPNRRTVESTVTVGAGGAEQVPTPGNDVNHLSAEITIEVSGASKDYPHPTRLNRELEAAVIETIEGYGTLVADDLDRGDGLETDGGESCPTVSKHAWKRWEQRADDPDCDIRVAWADGQRCTALGCHGDELRYHEPTETILVRRLGTLVTVIDATDIGGGPNIIDEEEDEDDRLLADGSGRGPGVGGPSAPPADWEAPARAEASDWSPIVDEPKHEELARELEQRPIVLAADAEDSAGGRSFRAVEIVLVERVNVVPPYVARAIYKRGMAVYDVTRVAGRDNLLITAGPREGWA